MDIQKLPAWVIAVVALAIAFVIGLLFFSKNPISCSKNEDGFACGFVRPLDAVTDKYYGYFSDLDEKGSVYCSHERIDVSFLSDDVSVRARSVAKVKDRDGNLVEESWIIQGYKYGEKLALAYITEHPPRSGNGVYYLIATQGEYAGFWLGVDSPSGKTIRCPYVLTRTEKPEVLSCEQRWPSVFSSTNACREISFPSK
ncbi:MAG: hypothetical protein IV094_15815 [Vitreoscilla sp.]|nr:hypothetical protein [Vitreoscilla sp.]